MGFALATLLNLGVILTSDGRATMVRFWMSWWRWVTGEMSTWDLIK